MRVLGINAYRPNSAAIAVDNHKILAGSLESSFSGVSGDSSYPSRTVSWLNNYEKPFDYVAVPETVHLSKIKQGLKVSGIDATVVTVDYKEALAQSAIAVNKLYNQDSAIGVLVVDDFFTAIGYYVDGEYHWNTVIDYPDSLSLFYSAATRFLGYKPMFEEHKVEELSVTGSPTFVDVIKEKVLEITPDGYKLLTNLEQGAGVVSSNSDIAASVQSVFTEAVFALANKIKKLYDPSSILFVGRGSENSLTSYKLITSGMFKNVFLGTNDSASSAALGAAALQTEVFFKSQYIGKKLESLTLPDTIAYQLVEGDIVDYNYGLSAYSTKSLGSTCKLTIPYKQNFEKLENPVALVLEEDYYTYFSNYCGRFGNTYADLKNNIIPHCNRLKCIKINSSSNPYLARIIALTKASGFPILVFSDTR